MSITSDQIVEIKKLLTKEFPKYKFSVRNIWSYGGVKIAILSGDVDFGTTLQNINRFRIKEEFTGDAQEVLEKVNEIACTYFTYEVHHRDIGYTSNYQINILIGDCVFDKEFTHTDQKLREVPYILNN